MQPIVNNIVESRKIELKETLSSGNKIERTAVAFSNDASGEIYIRIKNEQLKNLLLA